LYPTEFLEAFQKTEDNLRNILNQFNEEINNFPAVEDELTIEDDSYRSYRRTLNAINNINQIKRNLKEIKYKEWLKSVKVHELSLRNEIFNTKHNNLNAEYDYLLNQIRLTQENIQLKRLK
jgi:hypothetical protein